MESQCETPSEDRVPPLDIIPLEDTSDGKGITRAKVSEWLNVVSLRTVFGVIGKFVGMAVIPCVASIFVVVAFCPFIPGVHLKDRVRDGYTPSTSLARREMNILREFHNSTGDPAMTTVIFSRKDGGSMIDVKILDGVINYMKNIEKNVRVHNVSYQHFCEPNCDANAAVQYFNEFLKDQISKPSSRVKLTWPIASVNDHEIHLERNFNGVTLGSNFNITNIEHCKLITATYSANLVTEYEDAIAEWEVAVFEYANNVTATDVDIRIDVIGAEIVDLEMNKDGRKMTPYFVVGFCAAFIFTMLTGAASVYVYGFLRPRTLLIPVAATMVPVAAVAATYSIFSILGMRVNSLMQIMPFLIMGIGINDSFLMLHSWNRMRSQYFRCPRTRVMKKVFQDVGPSITMTTLTNVISFGIGSSMDTEEIAIFCSGCAIAMSLCYIITILFFGGVLAFFTPTEGGVLEQPNVPKKILKVHRVFDKLLTWFCDFLMSTLTKVLVLLVLCGYIVFACRGVLQIDSKLDTEKILPKDTPIHRPNRLIETTVWTEYYPVYVMVNKPFNVSDAAQRQLVLQMVDEFESMPTCRGKEFSMVWLRDFMNYHDTTGQNDFSFDEDVEIDPKGVYTSRGLNSFLSQYAYKFYKGFIKLDSKKDPSIQKFSFLIVYTNNTSWEDRIDLQVEWRNIAKKYENSLNATIWNVNGMFVDQMLSLKDVAISSTRLTLICMAIVCLTFIQNPSTVIVATLAIASIALGTVGYISFWDLDLDPVTICAILIAIGMSVDFTAHVSYHFANTTPIAGRRPTKQHRLKHSIGSMLWPSVQGNLSTLICVVPLILLKNYIPLVFVKTIALVVIIGSFHSFVIIPAVLTMIPDSIITFDLKVFIFGSHESLAIPQEMKELRGKEEEVKQNDAHPANIPLIEEPSVHL